MRRLAGTAAAIGAMALAFASVGGIGSALGEDGSHGRGDRDCRIGSPRCVASSTSTRTVTRTQTAGTTTTVTATVTQPALTTTTVLTGETTVYQGVKTVTTGTVTSTTDTVTDMVTTTVTDTSTGTVTLTESTRVNADLPMLLTCFYLGGTISSADPSNRVNLCEGTWGA